MAHSVSESDQGAVIARIALGINFDQGAPIRRDPVAAQIVRDGVDRYGGDR